MAAVEVVPSPKLQLREAIEPSLSVEVSVKATVSPLTLELKLATGATLAPPPPPAASTAARACRMPAPIGCEGVDGKARALLLRVDSTCAGVSGVAATDCINATTAATCGVAIEVPL